MLISANDGITAVLSVAIIAVALLCCEWTVKRKYLSPAVGRKLLHVSAICTCAWAIHRFENTRLLGFAFVAFFFILLAVIQRGWLQVSQTKSYGIALFPLAFGLLLLIPFFEKDAVLYAVLTLGLSDAAAGLAGERWGREKIRFLFEEKSWAGFAAFFCCQFVLTCVLLPGPFLMKLSLAFTLSVVPALTELFSYKGSDNFTVPLVTACWFQMVMLRSMDMVYTNILLTVVLLALCRLVVSMQWLTVSGATAAAWVALMLMNAGLLKAFAPPALFLLSGSLLSKLSAHEKESDGRDARQVFANGITGIGCLVAFAFTQHQAWLTAFCISFSIAMADSVSSETGVYFKGTTIDIRTLKKVNPGISGGISWQGSLAGLAGATLLAAMVGMIYHFSLARCAGIAVAGVAGMLADSLLGSLLQRKYRCANGRIVEDPEPDALLIKGFGWCGNNMVNLLSNALVTGIGLALLYWM